MESRQRATEKNCILGDTQQMLTDSDQWVPSRRGKTGNTDLIWHADSISSSLHIQLSGRAMSKGHHGDPSQGNVPIWCTDTQTRQWAVRAEKTGHVFTIKLHCQKFRTETCISVLNHTAQSRLKKSLGLEDFPESAFSKTRNSVPIFPFKKITADTVRFIGWDYTES